MNKILINIFVILTSIILIMQGMSWTVINVTIPQCKEMARNVGLTSKVYFDLLGSCHVFYKDHWVQIDSYYSVENISYP